MFRHVKVGMYGAVFGVITGERKGQKYSGDCRKEHEGSVGYWSTPRNKQGLISVDGERKVGPQDDLFIEEGGELTM